MADNCVRTPGSGETILADELTDGTLGSGKAQFVKVMDGTLDSSNKWAIGSDGAAYFCGPIAADSPISTSKPVLIGGRASTATPSAMSADGDVVHAWYDLYGRLHTQVDNTSIAGTAGTPNSGVLSVQGITSMTPVQVSQATAATLNCTEASASAIKTAAELIDDTVYVDDADWTDSTSKHLLVGGLYQSTLQSITDGDVGPVQLDANGRQLVSLVHPTRWQGVGEYTTSQTNASLKTAPGASLYLYITDVVINTAVAGTAKLIDGSGGSTVIGFPGLAANGGASHNFTTPVRLTANTALCITTTCSGNHTVTVTGYTGP